MASCKGQVADGKAEEILTWPTLPTETEIYILPDGEVVVADLPAELAALIHLLKQSQPL